MSKLWRRRTFRLGKDDRLPSTASLEPKKSQRSPPTTSVPEVGPMNTISARELAKDLGDVPRKVSISPSLPSIEDSEQIEKHSPTRRDYAVQQTKPMPRSPPPPVTSDVLIVGAGPAGLMLASNLIRFGINAEIIDNRSERTPRGRADGLQPKTIETLRQMRLADRILLKGVKVYDIRYWKSTLSEPLKRIGRDMHFPPHTLDCQDPYMLLAHQGFVEDLFEKDIMERAVEIRRNLTFVDYEYSTGPDIAIDVICKSNSSEKVALSAQYLVGCDGAHSGVRKSMGARPIGTSFDQVWGVLDGILDTDFPDIYSKTIIHSEDAGIVKISPRERGMTRLYVELRPEVRDGAPSGGLSQDFVINIAREILEPYHLRWKHIEWFGTFQIGQKVASKFQDDDCKIFLAGDATHTQSPNAAQGMNTSIHDAWNLAWKLNLAIRGLAKPSLLQTYEQERRQVAEDLMDFDFERSSVLSDGNMEAIADNFRRHTRFTSGYGADYALNVLNVALKGSSLGALRPGTLPPPAKVTRCFDMNPVDIQLDIPMLGQFRIYFFTRTLEHTRDFLDDISAHAISFTSILGKITCAANASYTLQPPLAALSDEFTRPERYTTVSGIFTFALVLQQKAKEIDTETLPQLWRDSRYTVYADDAPHLDTRYMSCTEKWLGGVSGSEVGIVVMRPDGYIGTVGRFVGRSKENGGKAARWLDDYFDGFLMSGF